MVIVAAAVYWYAFRPLPQTSGDLTAPVAHAATVQRDARGVPHVKAESWQDAIFLQGYVTAQDRLWQMDGLRRFGGGELSAVFGPGAFEQDRLARKMRLRKIAEDAAGRLDPVEQSLFAEYARGVNFFVQTHRNALPLEFRLPGRSYEPMPWTPADSLVIGLVMYRDQTDTASFDSNRAELFASALNPPRMRFLFPAAEGTMVMPGSNGWAVSGAHTASGKPMLANDPHLAYGIPPTWYLIHLKAPGLNVSGVSLPGVPGVLSGHNERIAWGFTNLETDSMDLYRENLNQKTGQYPFAGQTEQARLETETIAVRGAHPVRVDTWITRHGPVIGVGPHGESYSMRWTASDGVSFPFWKMDRAANWAEFRAATGELSGPALNFVYADVEGHIGYQAAGRVPLRHDFDGSTPADGSTGQQEWTGYLPFERMPTAFDPPSGIVATANQNPFGRGTFGDMPGNYADGYRVRQIEARLRAMPKLTVNDMLAIQKDVYSAYNHFLAQQAQDLIAHDKDRSPMLQEAGVLLRGWNGQMEKDEPQPLITELWSTAMEHALVAENLRRGVVRLLPRPAVIEELLRTRPHGFVPRDDWPAWLKQTLRAALLDGHNRLGSPMSHWRWGNVRQWNFLHPVGKQLPFVDRYFDIGPVPMSGSGTTIKQTTATLGPSERMVVDFGDLDKSVQNLTTGESGEVASSHYKDQWPAYYVGASFPMQFQYIDAKETLHIRPAAGLK